MARVSAMIAAWFFVLRTSCTSLAPVLRITEQGSTLDCKRLQRQTDDAPFFQPKREAWFKQVLARPQ
jgi:hypothetical protein